jgi:MYND finger
MADAHAEEPRTAQTMATNTVTLLYRQDPLPPVSVNTGGYYCTAVRPREIRVAVTVPTQRDVERLHEEKPPKPALLQVCWTCRKAAALQCNKCHTGKYCSTECQRTDFAIHKPRCTDGSFKQYLHSTELWRFAD